MNGYVIWDHGAGRPYVDVVWLTWRIAETERSQLLLGFPARSEWHRRLEVRPATGAPARPRQGQRRRA